MKTKNKTFIQKYLTAIDNSTFNHEEDGRIVEVVDAEYARSLIVEMMRDYERVNAVPKVDFWGQKI